jgi:hypothetical protein
MFISIFQFYDRLHRSYFRSIKYAFIAFMLVLSNTHAAGWQWSVPDGDSRAYLWIAPDCQRVRAVVEANHNMIEQGILDVVA